MNLKEGNREVEIEGKPWDTERILGDLQKAISSMEPLQGTDASSSTKTSLLDALGNAEQMMCNRNSTVVSTTVELRGGLRESVFFEVTRAHGVKMGYYRYTLYRKRPDSLPYYVEVEHGPTMIQHPDDIKHYQFVSKTSV